jgi:OOP family OmpA-OmpF porin
MKKNLLALAVIAAVSVGSANAALENSWTLGVGGGWAHGFDHSFSSDLWENNDFKGKDGYGIKAYGEYNFCSWFGLGLGYNYLGNQYIESTNNYTLESTKDKFHQNIIELYGRFAYTFDDKGSDIFFKVGPTFAISSFPEETDRRWGAVAGVGAQYQFTHNLGIRAGYDYFVNSARPHYVDRERLDEGLLYVAFQYTFGGPSAPVVEKVQSTQTHTLDAGILFPFDSSTLSSEGQSAVANVVQSGSKLENAQYEVYGYTDRIGSDAYNLKLSDRRADAVTAELQNNGVNPTVSDGRGKANPVTGNKCDGVKGRKAVIDCLAPDRRVEVIVTGLETRVKKD